MVYSDTYPEVAIKTGYSAPFIKRELTDLRDPRQAPYGEHLLKNIYEVKKASVLPHKNWAGMYSPGEKIISILDPNSSKRCNMNQKNILAHELGHVIDAIRRSDMVSNIPAPNESGSIGEQIENAEKRTGAIINIINHDRDVESPAINFEHRRKPIFDEYVSEYATPTYDEIAKYEEGMNIK